MINLRLTLKTVGDAAELKMTGKISCPREPEGCRGRGRINAEIGYWASRRVRGGKGLTVGKLSSKIVGELRRSLRGSLFGHGWRYQFYCRTCGVQFTLQTVARRFVRSSAEAYLAQAVSTKGRPRDYTFPVEDVAKTPLKKSQRRKK